MTAACCRVVNKDGLSMLRAYTFLGTIKLSNGEKLAHVRNPIGEEKYKGPWNDQDDRWNDKLLKEANHVRANDGSIYMPFDYYMKYFYILSVAYDEPYKYEKRWNYKMAKKILYFTVDNPQDQQVYITVETLSPRNYPRSCPFNTFINTYMRNDKGDLIGGTGYVGNGFYHNTKGRYGHKLKKGVYDFIIYNWNWDKYKQVVQFSLTVHAVEAAVVVN